MKIRICKIVRESSRDSDVFLGWLKAEEAPKVGELVNIAGDPFRVIDRSWAFENTRSTPEMAEQDAGETYCYIRVLQATRQ